MYGRRRSTTTKKKHRGPVVRRPISANPGLNFNPGPLFFSSKAFSRTIFSILFRVANHQIVDKKIKLNLLFKLLYLNSNLELTQSYLNPDLNNSALEFTFSMKACSFHLLACVRRNMSSNTWNGYTAENQEERLFSTRQHSYYGVTHCENSEVQIAVFSKWNMLREWKLVQRFTFCLSSTYCK